MIKILIVDDCAAKVKDINDIIDTFSKISKSNVECVTDRISAVKYMRNKQYDLLILDMKLPSRYGDDALELGGITLLREIKLNHQIKKPIHIIAITAFDNIAKELEEELRSLSVQLYHYTSDAKWKSKLVNKIDHILNAKNDSTNDFEFNYDIAIVTALSQPELKSVLNLNCNWSELTVSNDFIIYHTGYIRDDHKELRVIAASANQMGLTASAVLTTKINFLFKPKYIIMSGISAGLPGVTNIGDILIADSSWDYGSGKVEKQGRKTVFSTDPKQIPIDSEIKGQLASVQLANKYVNEIKNAWPGDSPDTNIRTHIGPVVSGSAVIQSSEIVKLVQKQSRKIIGIEMETYAVYYAAFNGVNPKPKALSIKAVCDHADEKKGNEFQKYAAYVSAQFIYRYALEYL